MSKRSKKFSIIICAYNIEKYISYSIESVLNQDFLDYELIIVNDGSTDNSLNEIKKHSDNRILIIDNKKNMGLGKSRNIGVKKASGEYILYLDGDDTLYDFQTLSKVNKLIEQEKSDIIYLGVQYVGGSNNSYIPNATNSTKEARITCDMHFAVASKCWRRQFLEEKDITFIEDIYYEDMVYSIKATIFAEKISYGEFPMYNYYRNREGSIMSTPSIKRCSDLYRMLSYLMDLYEITPKEYRKYLLSFIISETKNIPLRIEMILKALEGKTENPVLPKRDYTFDEEADW